MKTPARLKIVGRLGKSPRERGQLCALKSTCPDILALESGDFAVIGEDITEESRPALPPDAGCGARERIVLIPRAVLVAARIDIPTA